MKILGRCCSLPYPERHCNDVQVTFGGNVVVLAPHTPQTGILDTKEYWETRKRLFPSLSTHWWHLIGLSLNKKQFTFHVIPHTSHVFPIASGVPHERENCLESRADRSSGREFSLEWSNFPCCGVRSFPLRWLAHFTKT